MRILRPVSADISWPRRNSSMNVSGTPMGDVFENFDQIVDAFLRPSVANTVNFQPSCDVSETKDHYLVSFDMPGVRRENINIQVEGNELLISGERSRMVRDEEVESTIRTERRYGKFERSFKLPPTVASDKIEADYEDGVLHIALPKAEAAKARTIEVQTGREGLLGRLLGSKKDGDQLRDVKVK